MQDSLKELYYFQTKRKCIYNIMPIENIPSVIQNGILSFEKADSCEHVSVALEGVQDRRASVHIPNGLELHQYANLYMDFHNPMLYRRQDEADRICVLAIDISILETEGCILTDGNAAAGLTKFYSPEDGIRNIPFDIVFERNWNKPDDYDKMLHKIRKCAEVLIPHSIPYDYICGAYVLNELVKQKMINYGFDKEIVINPSVFYH